MKIAIGRQDVTRNASVTPQFFTWRCDLRPGTHQVDVTAADIAGNAVLQNWTFSVAGLQSPPPAAVLPLQITSHANNVQVGNGPIEVRGRTAPDARVDVQIQAIASVAGVFGIDQQVLNQSFRSGGNGNFAFTFQSPVPCRARATRSPSPPPEATWSANSGWCFSSSADAAGGRRHRRDGDAPAAGGARRPRPPTARPRLAVV